MTDQPQQTKTLDNSTDHYEDEIDLLFYIRVIWKYKYFIISGGLICTIIAAIAYFVIPVIYKGVNEADMVIEAGYVRSSEDSRKTIIRTREHLISDITSGYYDNDILNMLNADEKNIAGHLKFEAKNQGGNKVKVTYINSNAGEGVQILTCLIKVMSNHFSDTVNDCKDEIDLNIRKAKNEIVTFTHNKIMMEKKLIVAKNRLIEIEADINLIISNQIKPNILKSSNNNVQSSLLKDDKIIQRWMLLNAYKNETFSTSVEKVSYENHLIHNKENIGQLLAKCKYLENLKEKIKAIIVHQPPTLSFYSKSYITKKKVLLAIITGIFFMILLAFFIEHKKTKTKARMI